MHPGANEYSFEIHEVFYEMNEPVLWTIDSVAPYGETPEELKSELKMMLAACGKPVLDYEEEPA